MNLNAPKFKHYGVGWQAMLVNAAKNGSHSFDVCDHDKAPALYWAQLGLQMSENKIDVVWADTCRECHQAALTTNSDQVLEGHYIILQITVNDAY